jgi:putative ABC transport system permease protein
LIEILVRDIRHAIRMLLRDRLFTLAVVLSLGLGIGLNAAVFSFTDAVLLRPFPYKDADRLAIIWGTKSFDVRRGMDGADLENWRGGSRTLADIAVFQINAFPLSMGGNESDSIQAAMVGTRVFSLLGASALVGRTFSEIDEEPGGDRRVILSYGVWLSRFGGDRSVVGRSIHLNGELYTVVGVMPPEFFFPDQYFQVWVPLARATQMFSQVQGLARLRPGVALGQVQAELETLSKRGQRAKSPEGTETNPGIFSLYSVVVGKYEAALWALLGAVTLLLLIGCANVSNLLLGRGVGREKEFAVRVSLGASRASIIRMLLVENLLLSLVAGVFGIFCARWGVLLLRSLRLVDIPRFEWARIDSRVFLFALGVSLATGLASGVVPAWKSGRPDLLGPLQLGGLSTHPRGHGQLRDLLVTMEAALALALLVGASLLIQSFVRLSNADWGFNPDRLLVAEVRIPRSLVQTPSQRAEITGEVLERLSRIPGVATAAMTYGIPLRFFWRPTHLAVDGRFLNANWTAGTWIVSGGYFRTMGIPLLRGREFDERDGASAPRTMVVSRALAEKLWPGKDPIGKRVQILKLKKELFDRMYKSGTMSLDQNTARSEESWEPDGAAREVVGECANVRPFGLELEPNPALYVEYRQDTVLGPPSEQFVARTSVAPLTITSAVRGQILAVEKDATISDITTMSDLVSQSIGGRGSNKLLFVISTLFGTLSLLLAASGIYSVVSFGTAKRTREIGIRRTLGARAGDIVLMILAEGMRPVLLGLSLGLAGAWAFTRLLKGLLFSVTPTDIVTFVGASLLLLAAACAACIVPGLRALHVNPSEALRYE